MNRNKRFLALICSLAMVFSVFANFSVTVSAEDTNRGIQLTVADTDNELEKVITATAVGYPDGFASYAIVLNKPDEVASMKFENSCFGAASTQDGDITLADGTKAYNVAGFAGDNYKDGTTLVTIKVTLAAALTQDVELKLQTGSELGDELGDLVSVAAGTMDSASVVIPGPKTDPTNPPKVEITPVPVEKGIQLTVADTDNELEKVITATAVGYPDGFASYAIVLNKPAEVASMKYENSCFGAASTQDGDITLADGSPAYNVAGFAGDNYKDSTTLVTIKVTLAAPLTEDLVLQLQTGSELGDELGDLVSVATGMPQALVVVKAPASEPEPTEVPGPTSKPVITPVPVEKGIQLTVADTDNELEKVITATAVGYPDGFASYAIVLNKPAEVAKMSFENSCFGAASTQDGDITLADGTPAYNVAGFAGDNYKDGTTLVTIKVTLAAPLTEDLVLQLQTGSELGDELGDLVSVATGMPQALVVIEAPAAEEPTPTPPAATDVPSTPTDVPSTPTEAPAATAEPRPVRPTPVATVAPDEPSAPVATPVAVTKGIQLTLSDTDNELEKVITATAVGYPDGFASYAIVLNKPAEVAKMSFENSCFGTASTQDGDITLADGTPAYNVAGFAGDNYKDSTTMVTIKVTLAAPLTEPLVLQLQTGSELGDELGDLVSVANGMPQALVVIPAATAAEPTPGAPTATPTVAPTPVATIPVTDMVKEDDVPAADDEKVEVAYLTVSVSVTDTAGKTTELAYGDGYSAILTEDTKINILDDDGNIIDTYEAKAGEELPEYVYQNLIWGYTDVPMRNIVKNLTFKVNDPEAVVKTSLNIINKDGTSTSTGGQVSVSDIINQPTPTPVAPTTEPGTPTTAPTATPTVAPTNAPGGGGGGGGYWISTGGGSSSGSKGVISGSAGTTVNTAGNTGVNDIVTTFSDIGDAAWATTAITALAAKGAINGYDDGTFKPNQSITRAEFTKMLMGAYGIVIPDFAEAEITYSDVGENDWYYKYVYYGTKLGIVNGYEDGTFRPNNLVSRQEMAVIVYRMADVANTALNPVNAPKTFDDAYLIGDWAADAVSTLQQAGVINGTSDTTFEPTAGATRAQAAQIIYNVDLLR